ncbi:hypothetical protein [Cognatilysobacter terrigena]|uniref:hypothetical protein n=1 Tax=Cognatilysobacter terrigena TaxID=2488749 RepID=UPI00105B35DD|nr:hypothetical protein [Lysobacter terrigena]
MDPTPPPSTPHLDPATAAAQVSPRFERWFDERKLDLPPETRAEFVEMGMQALQRWPDRSTGDVLDELIAELDERLATIANEDARTGDGVRGDAQGAPRRGLGGLFRRRGKRTH